MIDLSEFYDLGIQVRPNQVEQKLTCPKCSQDRKNKADKPLSVNIEQGFYNCHHCGWSGNVKLKQRTKEYAKPVDVKSELSPRMIKYFEKRGISEPTLVNWNVGESVEFFPQIQKKRNAINFKYYREGKLINVKYRDAEKNFKLVSGAELIFYGLDNIKDSETIYIVEGEMDALSFNEAGLYSVCSVPNGASKGNQRLEYLDNCWEYFKDKKEIILCTDNDAAGLSLRTELARRFGQYRCKYVDFGEFKDANDVLVHKGAETLRSCIRDAKNFPLEGILNIDDIWESVLNYNEYGVKNYSISLGDSDDYFKMALGEWSVVTGIPNSGKSDVIDQICCNLAMRYDMRVGMFAPESFPYEGHIKRIANKLNQKNCNNETLNLTKDFIENHFYFVKIDLENLTLKGILDAFKDLVFQKGINVCVIDPYNMLDHSDQRDHSYVGRILSEITQFCQQTNTHLFLIAHPRKMEMNDGVYRVPTPYDISGSSDFFNKAYNCLTIYRSLNERTAYGSDAVKVYVQKVKRKENGSQGVFTIAPDFNNGGAYHPIDAKKQRIKVITDDVPF
jgi:twinkle protein